MANIEVKTDDRLSGHKQPGSDSYPTISVMDGKGAGNGRLVVSLESFHVCSVKKKKLETELWFESEGIYIKTDGVVIYHDGKFLSDNDV